VLLSNSIHVEEILLKQDEDKTNLTDLRWTIGNGMDRKSILG
jgi:hypothetical protein